MIPWPPQPAQYPSAKGRHVFDSYLLVDPLVRVILRRDRISKTVAVEC